METDPTVYEGFIIMDNEMNPIKLKGKFSVLEHQIKIQLDSGIQMYVDFDENHTFLSGMLNGIVAIIWLYRGDYNGIIAINDGNMVDFYKELCQKVPKHTEV